MKKYYEIHHGGAGAVMSPEGIKLIILNGNVWQKDLLSPLLQIDELEDYIKVKPSYTICFGNVVRNIPEDHWEALKKLVKFLLRGKNE